MKKNLFSFLFILSALSLSGHEFWLQPGKYFYNIREVADISFRVGENFTGDNWSGNRDNIKQLSHVLPSGAKMNLTDKISMNKGDSLKLPLQQEGTHMILFNSNNSFIDLEPGKFTAYLEEDGLQNALIYRSKNRETNKNGKEYYQRSVKTLIQVGNEKTDFCTAPTNLPLDIIPLENPYQSPGIRPSQELPNVRFRVLFKQKPIAGLLVKTWYRDENGDIKMQEYQTNNRGIITAKRYTGKFMVSCVYIERNKVDTVADWQSYWASLNFEYSSFFPTGR